MKSLIFYEKPGCLGNARQKETLIAAGFTYEVRSILSEPWTKESLRPFFENRPVTEWFNTTAPDVKNGSIKPEMYTEEEALGVMLLDPILIRRPLIDYQGQKSSGFDDHVMYDVLGLGSGRDDMEQCQSVTENEKCD